LLLIERHFFHVGLLLTADRLDFFRRSVCRGLKYGCALTGQQYLSRLCRLLLTKNVKYPRPMCSSRTLLKSFTNPSHVTPVLAWLVQFLLVESPLMGTLIMSKNNWAFEKVRDYDKDGLIRREVDKTFIALKEFRQKFPFAENLRTIEWLDPDKLFKLNPDEVGEFFNLMKAIFKLLGYSSLNSSKVYRNARLQINDLKNLLRIAVDNRKSLAQKVDASWEKIGGLGEDKKLAKKIIFCFNYESETVLPIFSNHHLRHFINRMVDAPSVQAKYFSFGKEYEHYTAELLKAKKNLPPTRSWDVMYFTRFLYKNYPPPDSEPVASQKRSVGNVVTEEQLDMQGFMKLLGELQRRGKIDGEQFREKRQLWIQQQPNDRDVLIWQLKQLLNTETNPNPPRNQLIERRKM
jgi:hypothetical protein